MVLHLMDGFSKHLLQSLIASFKALTQVLPVMIYKNAYSLCGVDYFHEYLERKSRVFAE